jgi:putative phosphoribosyl transferase
MEKLIHISDGEVTLEGMLKIPEAPHHVPKGVVLFAHGSGSSRFSPRNNFVADLLREGGMGTLLIDLLSSEEDQVYQTRFDIPLLAERLSTVVAWLQKAPETKGMPIGLFGSSTGAAAALQVAAALPGKIKAAVSRGGRPDLALAWLKELTAPTLLIVGGNDFGVIELNEQAYAVMECEKKLEVVPHATHLFEESGCLEQVARLARNWFEKYL